MADTPNNSEEMRRMQDEAVKRVREMQSRARRKVDAAVAKSVVGEEKTVTKKQASPPEKNNPITDIFDSLLSDSERTIILILILILSSEEADTGLILALMYLII